MLSRFKVQCAGPSGGPEPFRVQRPMPAIGTPSRSPLGFACSKRSKALNLYSLGQCRRAGCARSKGLTCDDAPTYLLPEAKA